MEPTVKSNKFRVFTLTLWENLYRWYVPSHWTALIKHLVSSHLVLTCPKATLSHLTLRVSFFHTSFMSSLKATWARGVQYWHKWLTIMIIKQHFAQWFCAVTLTGLCMSWTADSRSLSYSTYSVQWIIHNICYIWPFKLISRGLF